MNHHTDPNNLNRRVEPPFLGRTHWQHDKFLVRLVGTEIAITLADGGVQIKGRLLKFDKFTVLIERKDGEELYFKSALESIRGATK